MVTARGAMPTRSSHHVSSSRFVQDRKILRPDGSATERRSVTDREAEMTRRLIPGDAIVGYNGLGLSSPAPSMLKFRGRLGGR